MALGNGALLHRAFDAFHGVGAHGQASYSSDREDWGQDWENLVYGPNKAPTDLRDFSEVATVRFKDGTRRKIIRQKAAGPCRRIPVTPELNEYYLKSREDMIKRRRWDPIKIGLGLDDPI